MSTEEMCGYMDEVRYLCLDMEVHLQVGRP